MEGKLFVTPNQLRDMSYALGNLVKTPPDFLVALWRGGTPIGCCVHEFLKRKYKGKNIDHISVRTSRYTGTEGNKEVKIHGLNYIFENAKIGDTVLIVDDVWDAGTTLKAVMDKLSILKVNVETAVLFFKPQNNLYPDLSPNYYVEKSERWLVFPHELEGLSKEEIISNYGEGVWYMLNE